MITKRAVRYIIVIAGFCTWPAFGQSPEEIAVLMNRVSERLMLDEIEALEDVRKLPGDEAVAGLLLCFKQYYYRYKATPVQQEIAARSALYLTEAPTAAAYLKRLYEKQETDKPGPLKFQRTTALDCMIAAKNKFAVRTVCELLSNPELGIPPGELGLALAKMDLPAAPFTNAARKGATTPEGIAKWKEWWEAPRSTNVETFAFHSRLDLILWGMTETSVHPSRKRTSRRSGSQ